MDSLSELLTETMQNPSLWVYLLAYLGGLSVSFTPCIYPLIPVTLGILAGRGKDAPGGGFLHAVIFVSGISATYTLFGLVATATGSIFGQWQMNPWIFFFLGNLFLIMGLAKLGVFNFSFNLSERLSQRTLGGRSGTFLLGAVSGLAVGPCTAPVLATLLGYVAVSGKLLYSATLLFVFAFGMGTILVLLGIFGNLLTKLPKSGGWLVWVDRFLGIILIGAGQYFFIMMGKLMNS